MMVNPGSGQRDSRVCRPRIISCFFGDKGIHTNFFDPVYTLIYQLESLEHDGLKPYIDLPRSSRSRECDWFIAEGRWVVERLIASDHEVLSIVVGDQVSSSFVDQIPDQITTYRLPRELVSQLVGFEFHAGIIACGRRDPCRSLARVEETLPQSSPTIIVCPKTVLPDNMGSIIRSCTAFGCNALIVGPLSVDPWSRRSIRVSMGNIFKIPVIEPESQVDFESMLNLLANRFGYHLMAATGAPDSRQLPMPRPAQRLAIVLGNEAHGIPETIIEKCHCQVSIPMSGHTDSLNVAHAATILLYQFTRVSPLQQ